MSWDENTKGWPRSWPPPASLLGSPRASPDPQSPSLRPPPPSQAVAPKDISLCPFPSPRTARTPSWPPFVPQPPGPIPLPPLSLPTAVTSQPGSGGFFLRGRGGMASHLCGETPNPPSPDTSSLHQASSLGPRGSEGVPGARRLGWGGWGGRGGGGGGAGQGVVSAASAFFPAP